MMGPPVDLGDHKRALATLVPLRLIWARTRVVGALFQNYRSTITSQEAVPQLR